MTGPLIFRPLQNIGWSQGAAAAFGDFITGALKGLHGPLKRLGSAVEFKSFYNRMLTSSMEAGAAGRPYTFNDFWKEEQVRKLARGASTSYFEHPQFGTARKAALWGVAGLAAANVAGVDPWGATSIANTAFWGYGNYMIGRGIMETGLRKLGMGYIALTGLNALRPGNNTGPM